MELDKSLKGKKAELLNYFRQRAGEALTTIKEKYAATQADMRGRAINGSVNETRFLLETTLLQKAERENWTNQEKLECILMIAYCANVVMIESRNSVRPYEYMDFSRRVGELWDPFCKLCFYYPINDISLFVPPLFSEVKKKMTDEIDNYVNKLQISEEEKIELKNYYDKVWSLVSSGEIQLELDLHFTSNGQKYVVDFKSGFGSNEKGNTNRLLLVATVYQNLDENYKCLLFVRAEENNSYFNRLKKSGIWEAFCANEAYEKIKEYSGFDLRVWADANIDWPNDFNAETTAHLTDNNLLQYLLW
jgi:hypothetical protein